MNRSRLWLLAAVVLGFASAARAAPEPRPQAVIPLEPYLGVLWSFEAKVAGEPKRFLFDTGGGISVVSPSITGALGCKPWGQVTGFREKGDRVDAPRCDDARIEASGVALHVPTATVVDFSAIGLLPKDAPPIAGSIAMDMFAGRIITLDLAHRRLIVETPASARARIAGAKEIPVRFERDAGGLALTPLVPVKTPEGLAWMFLDCGSDAPMIVGSHVAKDLGLDPDNKHAQPISVELQGGIPIQSKAAVQEGLIVDGNIGEPIMRAWVLTFDLARQRLWIAPAR
jgi:hypothetical protein